MVLPSCSDSSTKLSKPTEAMSSNISPWLAYLAYRLGNYIVLPLFFGRMKVSGRENIPPQGPIILAPTHRSRWDALVVPMAAGKLACGRDLHFMISRNEYRGIQGWFMKRLGGFPVDASRPTIGSFRHSVNLLRQGEALTIFPEGNIYREQEVQPIKNGVARIALEAQSHLTNEAVKIIPIALSYSELCPTWGSDVTVEIGTPLDVSHYSNGSLRKNAQRLTCDLESALKKVCRTQQGCEDSFWMPTAS